MIYKSKEKKGSSLIEIIISMALLSILMIPLSSAIIQLVKTNKSGEVKQIASYEGQKILEEFKGYGEIKLINNKFTLLNGAELEKVNPDKDEYKSKFNVTNGNTEYEVGVSLVKENAFDNTVTENKDEFNINFSGDNKVYIDGSEAITLKSNYMKIKISNIQDDASQYEINFYSAKNESSETSYSSIIVKKLEEKEIIINVDKEYTNDLQIEIENNAQYNKNQRELNFEANIYRADDEVSRGIIDVVSTKGKNIIRVNRNLEVGANGTLEQLYIIKVNVKKKGQEDLLFESSNTQNIIIS